MPSLQHNNAQAQPDATLSAQNIQTRLYTSIDYLAFDAGKLGLNIEINHPYEVGGQTTPEPPEVPQQTKGARGGFHRTYVLELLT